MREAIAALDHELFVKTLGRVFNIRPAYAEEFPEEAWCKGAHRLVLVRLMAPGVFYHLPIVTDGPICICEDCCAILWECLVPEVDKQRAADVGEWGLSLGVPE